MALEGKKKKRLDRKLLRLDTHDDMQDTETALNFFIVFWIFIFFDFIFERILFPIIKVPITKDFGFIQIACCLYCVYMMHRIARRMK